MAIKASFGGANYKNASLMVVGMGSGGVWGEGDGKGVS